MNIQFEMESWIDPLNAIAIKDINGTDATVSSCGEARKFFPWKPILEREESFHNGRELIRRIREHLMTKDAMQKRIATNTSKPWKSINAWVVCELMPPLKNFWRSFKRFLDDWVWHQIYWMQTSTTASNEWVNAKREAEKRLFNDWLQRVISFVMTDLRVLYHCDNDSCRARKQTSSSESLNWRKIESHSCCHCQQTVDFVGELLD